MQKQNSWLYCYENKTNFKVFCFLLTMSLFTLLEISLSKRNSITYLNNFWCYALILACPYYYKQTDKKQNKVIKVSYL